MRKTQEAIKFIQGFHDQLQQIREKYQLSANLFDLLSAEEASIIKELDKTAKEELEGTVESITSGGEYQQAKETIKQSEELVKKLMDLTGKTKQEAEEIVYGKLDQKENFNESTYAERASHRNKKISDDDFELLKSLSARYSYTMQGDVKMHQFDQKSFYIPDCDKVNLGNEDMDYNKKGKKGRKRSFENLKYSPKMKQLAETDDLDLSMIYFRESLNTFLHLGQAVADAYNMGITFDIKFIKNNEEQLKRILHGIYTITGQIIAMPYKIGIGGYVSSCNVSPNIAWTIHGYKNDDYILSPFISCRS